MASKFTTVRGVTLNRSQWAAVCGFAATSGLLWWITERAKRGEDETAAIEALLPTQRHGPDPHAVTVGEITAPIKAWAALLGVTRSALDGTNPRERYGCDPPECAALEIESRLALCRPAGESTRPRTLRAEREARDVAKSERDAKSIERAERDARIRKRRACGETTTAIAAAEGLTKQRVSKILKESKP